MTRSRPFTFLAGAVVIPLLALAVAAWEMIDYASATKPDVPSGTAQELAERLGEIAPPLLGFPIDQLRGPVVCRCAVNL